MDSSFSTDFLEWFTFPRKDVGEGLEKLWIGRVIVQPVLPPRDFFDSHSERKEKSSSLSQNSFENARLRGRENVVESKNRESISCLISDYDLIRQKSVLAKEILHSCTVVPFRLSDFPYAHMTSGWKFPFFPVSSLNFFHIFWRKCARFHASTPILNFTPEHRSF